MPPPQIHASHTSKGSPPHAGTGFLLSVKSQHGRCEHTENECSQQRSTFGTGRSQLQACLRDSTRADPATRLTSSGIESTATVQEEGREAGTDVATAVVDQDSHYSTMPAEASVSAPHRARSVGVRHEPYLRSMGRRQPTETKST